MAAPGPGRTRTVCGHIVETASAFCHQETQSMITLEKELEANLKWPREIKTGTMSVVFAAISTILAFFSAIIMAVPILGQDQIDLPVAPIVNNLSVYDPNSNEAREAILGFNRKLWKSFKDQKRYTAYSLTLLAFSLGIQLSTQLFSLP